MELARPATNPAPMHRPHRARACPPLGLSGSPQQQVYNTIIKEGTFYLYVFRDTYPKFPRYTKKGRQ